MDFGIQGSKIQQQQRAQSITATQKTKIIKDSLQRTSRIYGRVQSPGLSSRNNVMVRSDKILKKQPNKKLSLIQDSRKRDQLENGFKLPPLQTQPMRQKDKENQSIQSTKSQQQPQQQQQQQNQQQVFKIRQYNIHSAQQSQNNNNREQKPSSYDFLSRTGVETDIELEKDKINMYFTTKSASLLHALNYQGYYITMNNNINNGGNKKKQQKNTENVDLQITKLKKIVATKAKYRYREKCQFQKSLIVQTLNINIKHIIEKLNENKLALDQFYDDLEDEYTEAEKQKVKHIKKDKHEINTDVLNHYRRKKGLMQNQKVFIIAGGYETLRRTLLEFGWYENPDKNSLCYDLKWTCKSKDIDNVNVLDCQIVNHYVGNGCLSSKQGFAKNLKNLIWYENININTFYPKCYDLNDQQEFEDFLEEFKFTKAESVLKYFKKQGRDPLNEGEICIIQISIAALNKKKKHVMTKLKEINLGIFPVISQEEWSFIQDYPYNTSMRSKDIEKIRSKIKRDVDLQREDIQDYVNEILDQEEMLNPQYHMQGDKNIWVIKPAGLSRGRGIRSFQTLEPMLTYVFCKDIQWVAQKYLESLYLIDGKKFDIRQWVIVTDFNPLTIFYYDECYIRICAEKYDVNDLNNKFAQVVNNSVQKKIQNFEDIQDETMMSMEDFSNYLEERDGNKNDSENNNDNIKDNENSSSDSNSQEKQEYSQNYKNYKSNNNPIFKSIKKKMIQAIINSMKSVQESIGQRKNTFELFGYDFMIDTKFNPWLIEINTSPSMECSTPVTKKIVKQGLYDTGKLINNYLAKGKRIGRDTDIGNWKFCYREVKDKQ